jgi:hypothetical protein
LDTALSSTTTPTVVRAQIAAYAAVRATSEALAQWRRQPPPLAGQPLPASFLKHSEDQTVAAVAAMHQAVVRCGWLGQSFADWGVIAAPGFLGRSGTANTLQRFAQEGAWGVSPHVIPHQSLHAVSGTLSQLLRIHGPNFGISGGPHAAREAFPIAAALLAEENLPGLWLLLTGHEREWIPIENAKSTEPARPPMCEAAALALVPAPSDAHGLFLRIGPDASRTGIRDFTLTALIAALSAAAAPAAWRLPAAGWVELEVVTLGVGSRR